MNLPRPLPQVIDGKIDGIKVIDGKIDDIKDEAPVLQAKLDLGLKKFVICITKDVPPEDIAILNGYGKVLDYDHECHNNVNPALFQWDFLILDLRESGDRYFLAKQIYPQRDKYHVICFHYFFEIDVLEDCDNEFTKFPKRQGVREDYESLLITKRVDKPRCLLSLVTCLFNYYSRSKN
jgi:hypothetical protein